MFCASPPPVSPCYGELSPCYGEIISLLSSCSACTVHRQTLPNLLLFKLIFLQKPVLRPPILPVFRLLSGSIRENQGAKPLLMTLPSSLPRKLGWSPGDLRCVNAVGRAQGLLGGTELLSWLCEECYEAPPAPTLVSEWLGRFVWIREPFARGLPLPGGPVGGRGS